jgi:hypothetical protein
MANIAYFFKKNLGTLRNEFFFLSSHCEISPKKKKKKTTEVIIGCDDGEIGSHEGAESLMDRRRRHCWACNSLPVFVFLVDDAHRNGRRRQKSCFESA